MNGVLEWLSTGRTASERMAVLENDGFRIEKMTQTKQKVTLWNQCLPPPSFFPPWINLENGEFSGGNTGELTEEVIGEHLRKSQCFEPVEPIPSSHFFTQVPCVLALRVRTTQFRMNRDLSCSSYAPPVTASVIFPVNPSCSSLAKHPEIRDRSRRHIATCTPYPSNQTVEISD